MARPRGERLLVVSRLLPYKRVDLVVEAATRAGLPLDVVGTGPAIDDLARLRGPASLSTARRRIEEIVELMEACRAVVVPGTEDFGIVSVEAQAAGKPVVAYRGRWVAGDGGGRSHGGILPRGERGSRARSGEACRRLRLPRRDRGPFRALLTGGFRERLLSAIAVEGSASVPTKRGPISGYSRSTTSAGFSVITRSCGTSA